MLQLTMTKDYGLYFRKLTNITRLGEEETFEIFEKINKKFGDGIGRVRHKENTIYIDVEQDIDNCSNTSHRNISLFLIICSVLAFLFTEILFLGIVLGGIGLFYGVKFIAGGRLIRNRVDLKFTEGDKNCKDLIECDIFIYSVPDSLTSENEHFPENIKVDYVETSEKFEEKARQLKNELFSLFD